MLLLMHPLHPPWADSEAAAAALPLRRMCQGAAKKFKLARNNHNGKRLETLLEQNRIQVSKLKKSCAEGLQVKKIHFLWARVGRWSEGQGCSKKPKRRESALAAEMQPHLIKNTESQFCFIHCTPPRGPKTHLKRIPNPCSTPAAAPPPRQLTSSVTVCSFF
jgi:hypothetical protein